MDANKALTDSEKDLKKAIELINDAVKAGSDTLILDYLRRLKKIPAEILKLPKLKHLSCRYCNDLKEIDIVLQLTELESLVFEEIDYEYGSFLAGLSKLKNLKKLHIDNFDFENEKFIKELTSLQYLEDFHTCFQDGLPYLGTNYDDENYEVVLRSYKFPESFKNLGKLKSFSHAHCQYHIDSVIEVLIDLPDLRELRICAQGTPTLLSKLTQLEKLDLSHWENLKKLPEDIGDLQNLKYLDLSADVEHMALKELPDSFYTLKNLEELYLYNCSHITHFKTEFQNLSSLHTLFTLGSSIYSIPFSAEQLANMKELSIRGEMPDLALCKNLKVLDYCQYGSNLSIYRGNYGAIKQFSLRGTNIEELKQLEVLRLYGGFLADASFLSELSSLKRLTLQCDIAYLPADIGKLKNLEVITMRKAVSFKTFPESFGELESLRELTIEHSHLEELPSSLVNLQSLERLELENITGLTKIPKEIFKMPKLKISLGGNCHKLKEEDEYLH